MSSDSPIFDNLMLEYFGENWMDSTPVKPYSSPLPVIEKMVPGIQNLEVVCPACLQKLPEKVVLNSLLIVIIELNDEHKWTREQIAEWLDTLDFDLTLQKIGEEETK